MSSIRELKLMVELGNRQAKVNNEILGWKGISTNTAEMDAYLLEDREAGDLIEDPTADDIDYDIEHDPQAQAEIEDSVEEVIAKMMPELEKRAESKAIKQNPYTPTIEQNGKSIKPLYYPVQMIVPRKTKGRVSQPLTAEELEENDDREKFNTQFVETILPQTMDEIVRDEREKQTAILTGLYKEKRINEAKTLNIGEQPTTQYPNESNEDYVARLALINTSLPDKDTIIAQQKKKQRLKLIKSFKGVATPVDAEEIVRDLSDDEVLVLNRTIKAFLEDLRKKYTKLDVKTFQIMAHTWVRRVEQMTTGTGSVMKDIRDDASQANVPELRKQEAVSGSSATAGEMGPIQEAEMEPSVAGRTWSSILADFRPTPTTSKYTKKVWLEKLREAGLIREKGDADEQGMLSFNPYSPNETAKSIARKMVDELFRLAEKEPDARTGKYKPDDTIKNEEVLGLGVSLSQRRHKMQTANIHKKIIQGRGIAPPSQMQKYVPFGKFIIDEPRLKNGVLSVLYHTTGVHIPDFKVQQISNDLKQEIETIIDTGKWTERSMKHLDKGDQTLLKTLMERSGVAEAMGIKGLETDEMREDFNRWELLKGEVRIGNNSPRIIKEMEQLIHKFMDVKRIKKQEGYKLLYELKSLV